MKVLNAVELKQFWSKNNRSSDIVVLDIREPDEYARERIDGSINIPLSQWDQLDHTLFQDKIVLVHCQSGNRTMQAQHKLSQLCCKEIFCIAGGLNDWRSCGLGTKCDKKAPLEIRRQVQMIVGMMLLLGVLLSHLVSPYFILITVFFAAGLLFAGITGWCGLANMLMLMPYNRQTR